MNCLKTTDEHCALRVGAVLFAVGGLIHVWRLFAQVPFIIGDSVIPLWASGVIAVLAFALSFWFFSISRRISHPIV